MHGHGMCVGRMLLSAAAPLCKWDRALISAGARVPQTRRSRVLRLAGSSFSGMGITKCVEEVAIAVNLVCVESGPRARRLLADYGYSRGPRIYPRRGKHVSAVCHNT